MALRWRPAASALGLLLITAVADPRAGTAATFEDGQRAYDMERFEEARRVWAPLAAGGDARAQFAMGLLHDLGHGAARDPGAAYGWYRRAAEAGLPQAQFNVAVMRDAGRGVPRDTSQAATWYAKAAVRGQPRAKYNLAQLYASGEGVPRNVAQARTWYGAAAREGLAAAADKLARLAESDVPGVSRPAAEGARSPTPPVPVAPGPDAVLEARGDPVEVELVWEAPTQHDLVRFFVQLCTFDDQGSREVSAHYVDESATLVRLAAVPARYSWRVFAVAEGAPDYKASPWSDFAVASGEPD